jgi:hypothetical protein
VALTPPQVEQRFFTQPITEIVSVKKRKKDTQMDLNNFITPVSTLPFFN